MAAKAIPSSKVVRMGLMHRPIGMFLNTRIRTTSMLHMVSERSQQMAVAEAHNVRVIFQKKC